MEADEIGDINIPVAAGINFLQDDDTSGINMSDVIEVIQTTDPTSALAMFTAIGGQQAPIPSNTLSVSPGLGNPQQMNNIMNHQLNAQPPAPPASISGSSTSQSSSSSVRKTAYVKITEQPASKALRFRYECEGRSAGSIPGVNSTPENKTFPSIQICEYKGRAVVVVSCVTKDPPYRPHPHNLVGKEGCKKGVCTIEINSETMSVVFSNLGIQCVKKKDIEDALKVREEIRVDPFRTGFTHRSQPSSIDLNAVRLCFQVFLESEQKGRFTIPLPPVVSDPIFDKKAMSDLVICKLSECSCTVAGGKEIILLCEKVAKEDISVRFFEEHDGQMVWEGYGDFQHTNVHKQVAISFRTPRYRVLEVDQPIKTYIQLKRPSDGTTSEALRFDYLPLDSDPVELKRKRHKHGGEAGTHLFRHFQNQDPQHQQPQQIQNLAQDGRSPSHAIGGYFNIVPEAAAIKTEPRETSPSPYNLFNNNTTYRVPQGSPSPQPLSPATPVYGGGGNTPSPYNMAGTGTLNFQQNEPYQGNDNISPLNFGGVQNYQQQFTNYNPMQPNQQTTAAQQQPVWNMNATTITSNKQLINTSVHTISSTISNFPTGNLSNTNPTGVSLTDAQIPSNLSSLLDLDSQQLTQFNSTDLTGISLSLLDGTYNSGIVGNDGQTVSQQLEATIKQEQQNKMDVEQENMTDSFTRLTTATINELTTLSKMYNNDNKRINN